jgi:hypothetical protein
MLDILRNRENNGIDYTGRAGIDDVTPSRGVD